MVRHRVEDLGRIAVMLKNLTQEHPLFDEAKRPWRPKDVHEWWETLSPEHRDDMLHHWGYAIEGLQFALYDILSIAEGTDYLNDEQMD